MLTDNPAAPRQYQGVMVSSTFKDLKEHREALMAALRREELFAIGMEEYVPVPDDDLISSSLNMVRKGSAYIGLISHRYGQVPECPERNPHEYSICRLEFEEAQARDLPTLVFIMGEDHPVQKADVETDAEKIKKLEAYRRRAQEGRIYVDFNGVDDFTQKAIHAVASLRRYLEERAEPPAQQPTDAAPAPIPTPPAFYAEPAYIGSHEFVGRASQLETLSDWATPADAHPILLFEAIGGAGKSILTWEWADRLAAEVRDDWAGRFWYSFYEKGAIMADFCGRALAYMTRRPFEDFRKKKTPELAEQLLRHLQERPWLLILDGLERVLVAYQRFDAAQLRDEEADHPTDQIAHRDPCDAIRPEDDDLLRALAGAAPSKLLITTRLTPRTLLNSASQAIPGVLRERLPGLRPADAEALLRNCGVTGTSTEMQRYLKTHCDCHPLVTGVLAGLINDYLPDRGNFDAWAAAPDGGEQLNLADLNLNQKRNHILTAALDALPEESRRLLSTLALLSEAVDYPTLSAFNPHLPPETQEMEGGEGLAAQQALTMTVGDLERRGLLQYDARTKRHDLHPVVRSVVTGRLREDEKDRLGQCVVDHFSPKAHSPYEEAETLEDVRDGLHVVRTLLQMGRHQQAYDAYRGDLGDALIFNLEASAEILSLLRPFFPQGWGTLSDDLCAYDASFVANDVGTALHRTGASEEALAVHSPVLHVSLRDANWANVAVGMYQISTGLAAENRLAREERCLVLALDLAAQCGRNDLLFGARVDRFAHLAKVGRPTDAEAIWELLDPMGRNWPRNLYRPGQAEYRYARFRFWQEQLTDEHLVNAEQLGEAGKDRSVVRSLLALRGAWQLEQGRYGRAAESLHKAVHMARQVGHTDAAAETQLVIARFHLNQLRDPREAAEQLAQAKKPFHCGLAELWLAIGDREQVERHARKAYEWAWADGEPYVDRYELNKSRALLEQLGAEIPDLPPYDPAKDEKFPWEDDVAAAIEKLRLENEAKKRDKS